MSKRAPTELWHEIFQFLPRNSLKNIHATDRWFRAASRPLIFRHLVLQPYRHLERVVPALHAHDEVQRALDRLEFWSSDEIYPHVRVCTIIAWHRRAAEADSVPLEHTDSPHILMISFLNCLDKFTGLKKFSATLVDFTQAGLANLCRLPLLREVVIERCDIFPGENIDTTSLQLRTTRLNYHAKFVAHENKKPDLWLSIVDRDHLHELESRGGDTRAAAKTISEGLAFPNVHHLQLFINFSTMNRNFATLAKFPAVRKLRLIGSGEPQYESTDAPSLRASDVLPVLQEYSGVWGPLHMFLPKPTLARLVVSYCTPVQLSSQLRGEYGHITSLDAVLTSLDQQTISTIGTCLAGLVDLRIQISSDVEEDEVEDGFNPKATDFFATLADADTPNLPPTLKRLAISWEFEFMFGHDEGRLASPDNIPDFLAMRDKLRERCPALTMLWLDGYDFMFWWRQSLDGEEMEQELKIEATEIYSRRGKFEDFWEAG